MYLCVLASRLRHTVNQFALGQRVSSTSVALTTSNAPQLNDLYWPVQECWYGVYPFSFSLYLSSAHISISLTRSLFSPSCCAFGGRARPKCPTQRYLFLSLLIPLSINPALFLPHMPSSGCGWLERWGRSLKIHLQESEDTFFVQYPIIFHPIKSISNHTFLLKYIFLVMLCAIQCMLLFIVPPQKQISLQLMSSRPRNSGMFEGKIL